MNFDSSFESTTQMPSVVTALVQNHFARSATILENVFNLVDVIASVEQIYERTDKKLFLDVAILDNISLEKNVFFS